MLRPGGAQRFFARETLNGVVARRSGIEDLAEPVLGE
jgi:hypothetical protein